MPELLARSSSEGIYPQHGATAGAASVLARGLGSYTAKLWLPNTLVRELVHPAIHNANPLFALVVGEPRRRQGC